MISNNPQKTTPQIPTNLLLSLDKQPPIFHRINIEYFLLYNDITLDATKNAVLNGLSNNLIHTNADLRRKAAQWKPEHDEILDALALKVTLEIKRQQKQFPLAALKRLPPDIKGTEQLLTKVPNDHLCHFHLGWLYSIAKNHPLAETHFNIAALQSQTINPSFSCFAYRHLANTRLKNGKHAQALLAIEAACDLSPHYNSELQFERIRLLSQAQRTTQALSHLAILSNKAPHYETFASYDPDLQKNPSLRRYFQQTQENHIKNIRHQLLDRWKNDPLHLLNLDKELQQKDSLKTLQKKQNEILLKLPPLLIFDEEVSGELIQKCSRSIIVGSLNRRKQQYIKGIEGHQAFSKQIHNTGQWMLYAAVLSLIALGLSYAISTIAYQFNYHWPVNLQVQSVILGCTIGLTLFGCILLHFTPTKLTSLLRQKQRLDDLSLRLGVSAG